MKIRSTILIDKAKVPFSLPTGPGMKSSGGTKSERPTQKTPSGGRQDGRGADARARSPARKLERTMEHGRTEGMKEGKEGRKEGENKREGRRENEGRKIIRPTCIQTERRSLYVIGWNRRERERAGRDRDVAATKRRRVPLLHARAQEGRRLRSDSRPIKL